MAYENLQEDLGSSSDLYFKPKDGENRIRFVSEPVRIYTSFNRATKEARLFLSSEGAKEYNKTAPKDMQAKPRWRVYVLNRDNGNKLQIGEFGPQVMEYFKDLANSSEYGFNSVDALTFDFILTKKGAGMDTEYMLTASRRESPLTDAEKQMVHDAKPIADMLKDDKSVQDHPQLTELDVAKANAPVAKEGEIDVSSIPFT